MNLKEKANALKTYILVLFIAMSGNLSPLLANIYLNEFDQEFQKRGVPVVRYADDIVLLARSERAAKRLLETSTKYLEGQLKLTVNRDKSRVVSVFAIRNLNFLALHWEGTERAYLSAFIQSHGRNLKPD